MRVGETVVQQLAGSNCVRGRAVGGTEMQTDRALCGRGE